MKRWRCKVCGYIHEGEVPPETCPVCGAPKEEFVEIDEEETHDEAGGDAGGDAGRDRDAGGDAGSGTRAGGGAGEDADRDAGAETGNDPQGPGRARKDEPPPGLLGWMARERSHAITVHVPNGVLPVATFFLVLGSLFAAGGLSLAAQYNMMAVLLAMPFVMFSGYVDWQAHYGGVMTRPILLKIICGAVVLGVSLLIVLWWQRDAASIRSDWMLTSVFVLLHLVALGAAGVAGYLGGRLAFGAGRSDG